MPKTGVPIKVLIGLKKTPKGDIHHDHPDFTQLPLEKIRGEDNLSHQIVEWRYDNSSGHDTTVADSPEGFQLAMLVVSRTFADEALAMYPTLVTEMNDVEAKGFWEDRANQRIPGQRFDTNALAGLKVIYDLRKALAMPTTAIETKIQNALNPTHKEMGVHDNPERSWAQVQARRDFTAG